MHTDSAPSRDVITTNIISRDVPILGYARVETPVSARLSAVEEHLLVRDGPFCAFVGLPFLRESFLTMTAPGPDQLRQQVTYLSLSLSLSLSNVGMDSAEAVP